MISGLHFVDILVSEVTMVVAALIFLFCGTLLIFKRRALKGAQKKLALAVLIAAGVYLALIVLLAVMWGQQIPQPVPQPVP